MNARGVRYAKVYTTLDSEDASASYHAVFVNTAINREEAERLAAAFVAEHPPGAPLTMDG
jgi:hypothetical protein